MSLSLIFNPITQNLDFVNTAGSVTSSLVEDTTSVINGVNKKFIFTTKPIILIIDGAIYRTQGWTWDGTSVVTTTIPPTYECYALI